MTRKSVWTSSPTGDGQRFELEPAGFVASYRLALAAFIVCGGLVLPLSLTAIFAALVFDDFGVALRIGFGGVGVGSTAAVIWLGVRILVDALALRSRVRVTSGGVLVETGVTSARKHVWLTPLDAVLVEQPKVDSLERGGIELVAGDTSIRIAMGYRERDTTRLLKAVRAALKNTVGDAGKPHSGEPLGPPWADRVRRLGRDIVAPLRHPTPYLLVDLGAIFGTSVLTWVLSEVIDWRDAYPIAFALFLAGLAARRYDGTYVAGLREHLHDDGNWGLWYMLAGIAIALAGAGGMTPRLSFGPAVGVAALSSIGLHWAMLRRARSDATPKPNRKLDLVLALSLVPISILHEAAMFEFIVGSTKDLAVMSLGMVPVTVLLAYAPVRLHAFVDNPGDRSNVAWFWLTAIWLGLGPILAVSVAAAREM